MGQIQIFLRERPFARPKVKKICSRYACPPPSHRWYSADHCRRDDWSRNTHVGLTTHGRQAVSVFTRGWLDTDAVIVVGVTSRVTSVRAPWRVLGVLGAGSGHRCVGQVSVVGGRTGDSRLTNGRPSTLLAGVIAQCACESLTIRERDKIRGYDRPTVDTRASSELSTAPHD